MLFLIAQGCRLSPVTSTVFVVELRRFLECCDFSSRRCVFEVKRHSKVAAFTVYNKVPDLNVPSRAAFEVFNEVILEELSSRELPIIDLRVLFFYEQDYSPVSPIELSVNGGRKIVLKIEKLIESGFKSGIYI